ncbi:MAG TPA: 30S ribosomal protein S17 [Blastocatellia bacterium]
MDESISNQETQPGEIPPAIKTTAKSERADRGRRAEKIGIVTSDKMMKTVVVRVDRLVKHPVYKRYIRKRSKFMAHNEIEGVSAGDQVRIVETRPLSARKRWRVVEVLRKASK